MALYHLTVSQIRRSAGQSAIAAAAYRAGECLYSDYYGEYSDYTRKGGVICSEILLPPHAPLEYQDRATLWNTVEQVEKHKKAQLAYSFDIALQNELSMEENIALAREFVQRCLVDKGMVADFAVHAPDKEDGGMVSCGEYPRSDYLRRCVPTGAGADCQQTQTAKGRHNADFFRAGKVCGLRLVAGIRRE